MTRTHDARSPSRPEVRLPHPQLEAIQRCPGPPGLAHPLGRSGDAPNVALPGASPAWCPVPVQRFGHRMPAHSAVRLPPHPAGHRGVRPLALRVDEPGPARPRLHDPLPPGCHGPCHPAEASRRAAPPGPRQHRAEGLRRRRVEGPAARLFQQHGYSKRRTWLKLHLAVDPQTHEIQAAMVTDPGVTDAETVPALLEQVENPVESAAADGAYDRQVVYDALEGRSARAVIPPRRDAKIKRHGNSSGPRLARDENLRRIRKVGRAAWKEESGYHERSLVETAMLRMKTIFGDGVASRSPAQQATEAGVRCRALNIMTHQGMPQSERIAG